MKLKNNFEFVIASNYDTRSNLKPLIYTKREKLAQAAITNRVAAIIQS